MFVKLDPDDDEITSPASAASTPRSRTCGRLYLYDAVLERLAPDLEPMTATLRPCIQAEDAVMGQRHLARPRHLAPADPPDVRDGVMGGTTRPRGDQRRIVAGEAGDAVDTRGLDGFGEGRGWEDGGEPALQHPGADSPIMGCDTHARRTAWSIPTSTRPPGRDHEFCLTSCHSFQVQSCLGPLPRVCCHDRGCSPVWRHPLRSLLRRA